MQNERDVWDTTFFHRVIRKTIGETPSQSKTYDLSQPLPKRLRDLLEQLCSEQHRPDGHRLRRRHTRQPRRNVLRKDSRRRFDGIFGIPSIAGVKRRRTTECH